MKDVGGFGKLDQIFNYNKSSNELVNNLMNELQNVDYSEILYACEDCEKINQSTEIGSLYKLYLRNLNHFEKSIKSFSRDLFGEELANNSNWIGEDGWNNYGYPTMVRVWGTLGTVATLGGYSMTTIQLFNTSFIGNATYSQARWWMWDSFSLSVGTYNLVRPNNIFGNRISPYVDFVDMTRTPFSYMNWRFRGYNFYNNMNRLNR